MRILEKKQLSRDDILITNLYSLIQEHQINEAELSRRTGIPQPTLHKILSGKTTDPRISTLLQTLASYFNITLDNLFSDNVLQSKAQIAKAISIPIFSWTDCLKARDLIQKLTPSTWEHWVVIDNSNNTHTYGLISKASMEPRFPRGTILIVDTQTKPTDGDFVIVHYATTKEATMRELSIDGPHQLLLPLNQNSVSDKLDKSIRIVGTVIQSRFSY